MKKPIFAVAAVALIAFSACAPKSNSTLDDVVNDIDPNYYAVSEVSSEVSSEAEVKLDMNEVVKVGFCEKDSYTFDGERIDYSYEYPQLYIPNVNLTKVNDSISNYCNALIGVETKAMNEGRQIEMTKMGYSANAKNNVLSVVIRSEFGDQFTLCKAINISVKTGAELTNNEVILAAGFTSSDGEAKILNAAKDKFTQLYGQSDDYNTPDEITAYERAKAATEVDFDVDMSLFFDQNGSLKAMVRIYEPLTDDSYDYFEVKVA